MKEELFQIMVENNYSVPYADRARNQEDGDETHVKHHTSTLRATQYDKENIGWKKETSKIVQRTIQ